MAIFYPRLSYFFSKIRIFSKNLLYKTKRPNIRKSMIHENVTKDLKTSMCNTFKTDIV